MALVLNRTVSSTSHTMNKEPAKLPRKLNTLQQQMGPSSQGVQTPAVCQSFLLSSHGGVSVTALSNL